MQNMDDKFGAADINNDGMLNMAEFVDYLGKQHLDRLAKYPAGWLPAATEEQNK